MNQLPFIYQIRNRLETTYEIQREGLEFLQSLQNKKVILIFTVTTNINPYPFSSAFSNQNDPQSANVHFSYPLSSITISRQIQLIQPDYVLLIMNYCHKSEGTLLLLFGYLMASVMLFHNEGELNMKSSIVQLLAQLQKIIENSQYKQIDRHEDRKWMDFGDKIDNLSIPDFYCLMHNQRPQSSKASFKNIFKDFSTSSTRELERSIQALGYLFYNRRSQPISSPDCKADFLKTVEKVKSDIISNISCKRFLGYQTTGATIKHLSYQLVISHNSGLKQINFPDLKQKFFLNIIQTQKQFGICLYIKKLSYRIKLKDLPMQNEQILKIHQQSINQTFEQFSSTVKCGGFGELQAFINVWKQILQKCGQHLAYILDQNQKAIKSLNQLLITQLSGVQISYHSTTLSSVFLPSYSQIIELISIYTSKSVGLQSKYSAIPLITGLLKTFSERYQQALSDAVKHINQLQTKNLVMNHRNQYIQKQNQIMRYRVDQLYAQKQLISYINDSKDSQQNTRQELIKKRTRYKTTISSLQKQVNNLQLKLNQQILKRKTVQDDLIDVSDKYEHLLNKQKSKISTTAIGVIAKQLKESIQTFQKISTKVHKMQGIYKYAKQIATQNKKLSQEIIKKTATNKQLEIENSKLYNNITTYNSTISQLEWNAECHKNNIRELLTETGGYKVSIADMDAKIQVYGKCLKLIKGYQRSGKYQPLWNFIKISQYQDIKLQIEELLK